MTTTFDEVRPYAASTTKKAVLYRMVMPGHLCPFGLKAHHLLRSKGYEVENHHLTSREETDAFKQEHGVKTTPQTFIDGNRVGGYSELREFFGYHVRAKGETTYTPVVAIFAPMALAALALVFNLANGFAADGLSFLTAIKFFIALSMIALAIQKLQDVEGFANGFLGYDLLAQRWVPYARIYPFAEAYAGIGMLALIGSGSPLIWLVAPVGLFIGLIGSISVIKAVYVEKRELKCACVGADSNVPLGAISLTENVMMVLMGVWMIGMQLV